jgi:hypothetical protein
MALARFISPLARFAPRLLGVIAVIAGVFLCLAAVRPVTAGLL